MISFIKIQTSTPIFFDEYTKEKLNAKKKNSQL